VTPKPPGPSKKGGADEAERFQIGVVAGLAWAGKADQARAEAGKLSSADARFRALLEIAEHTGQASDAEAAITALGVAVSNVLKKGGKTDRLAWQGLRLVRIAQQAGVSAERLEQASSLIPAPLAGWGQLAVLRGRLSASRSMESADVLDKVSPQTLAHQLARLELSWHNTARSPSWGSTVQGWEEKDRAFGSLGVALGMQGGR
jgi:hypothetical protein